MDKEKIKSLFKKEWSIPYEPKITRVVKSFSLTEKTVFYFFAIIFSISALSLLYQVNKMFLVDVPDYGGSLTEGILGSPRFINPILASSDIDKDLTSLIYSGLLKTNSDGHLIPDIAESYKISEDGLTYTFVLRDDVYFHDGQKLTTDDVVFTIKTIQNPNLKSPRETNWIGVNVEKIDERTISFSLSQAYSPFIQNFTLGIVPEHIWKNASIEEFPFSQFNTKPIGSGPYKISSIAYTSSGLPSEYHLVSFSKYVFGRPYITNIIIKSFQKEEDLISALKKEQIQSIHSPSTQSLIELETDKNKILLSPLPRIFGLFFNQNIAQIFVNKEVRRALDIATNKETIVKEVLGGYGKTIDGPVPDKNVVKSNTQTKTDEEKITEAKNLLESNGWSLNNSGVFEKKGIGKLSFSISTGDAPELKNTAYILQNQWRKMGAEVEVKIFGIGDLNQNIIRPRKYDSLLFGKIVGRDLDLYPFWHSSQRTTPGLNIALYTNIKVDRLLENIRNTTDLDKQKEYLETFNTEIKNDVPAVFTYSPYFIYIVPKKVKNVNLGSLTIPHERFNNIHEWYIETNNVWVFLAK